MSISINPITDSSAIIISKPSRVLRWTYYGLLILIVFSLIWAYYSEVDIAVHALGQIRPLTGIQSVQSPYTSHIRSLRIQENQFVRAGDTLAILDVQTLDQNEKLISKKIQHIEYEIADLKHLNDLREYRFHFNLFKDELHVRLKEREIIEREISLLKDEFVRDKTMFEKNLLSNDDFKQITNKLAQKELELEKWNHNHSRDIFQRIENLKLQLFEKNNELTSQQIEKAKYFLKTPTDGYVSLLNFKSENTLVKAGESICSISPKEKQVAEFYIDAGDIGFIKEGLDIHYQIDAFPFQEWGTPTGKVESVGKDFNLNEKTQVAFFKIVGSFLSSELYSTRQNQTAQLKSGMTFRANVVVARKRLINMLWDKTVHYFAL